MTGPTGRPADERPRPEERISERILAVERRRRGGPDRADPPEPARPGADPPISVLAGRCFPGWVLDRRDRFFAASGLGPAAGRRIEVLASLSDLVPGPWTAEDYVAAVRAAPAVSTADAFLAALARSLGVTCEGPDAGPDATARIDGWLDRRFGPPVPGDPYDRPPAWARIEAVTTTADRRFGRSGPSGRWEHLSAGLWHLGEIKRRFRP